MITLRQEQKDLVLDFYFQCGTKEHLDSAKNLIDTDPRAKELLEQLKETLGYLDHVDHDEHAECPDHLTDMTVNKLKIASSAENARLQTLLAEEGQKDTSDTPPKENIQISRFRSFWNNMPDVATVACVLLIVASVAFPTLNHMRGIANRVACTASMHRVSDGLSQYQNDHKSMPAVATSLGDPWWKVGDQGNKNQSNTRHPWLLVKQGYVQAPDFVCKGRKDGIRVNYTKEQLEKLNDFESRRHMSYSYLYMCQKRAKHQWDSQTALMADRNPVFESLLPSRTSMQFQQLSVGDQLRHAMSSSHKRGQVVLFHDGSARFMKVRIIGGDDIYTAEDKQAYTGCEIPEGFKDIFLVP